MSHERPARYCKNGSRLTTRPSDITAPLILNGRSLRGGGHHALNSREVYYTTETNCFREALETPVKRCIFARGWRWIPGRFSAGPAEGQSNQSVVRHP